MPRGRRKNQVEEQVTEERVEDNTSSSADDGWNEAQGGAGNYWIPESRGETIQGVLVDAVEGPYGTNYVLEIDGTEIRLPANKVLISKLDNVPMGAEVKVEYLGTVRTSTGRRAKDYRVLWRESE